MAEIRIIHFTYVPSASILHSLTGCADRSTGSTKSVKHSNLNFTELKMNTSFLSSSVLAAVLSVSSAAAFAGDAASSNVVDAGLNQGMRLAYGIADTTSTKAVLTLPASASRDQVGDYNGVEMAWGTPRIAASHVETSAAAVKTNVAVSTPDFDARTLAWGINS
jgi:hypothetical protein